MPGIPELEFDRIRQFCDRRVPDDRRDEARVEADVHGTSVTIFDCRPPWHPDDTDWSRVPVAQLRYDPGRATWTLYWAGGNGRWHRYDEIAPGSADQLLDEIDDDPTCVFWG